MAYDKRGDRLIWQDLKGHVIKSVDRSTGEISNWQVFLGSTVIPGDLCVDQKSRTVYFCLTHLGTPRTFSMQAASLDTGKVWEVIPRSSHVIRTVDFDATRNALVYTMSDTAADPFAVWRYSLASRQSEQVVPAREQCRSMLRCAVDASGKRLFWGRNDEDDKLDGIWTMKLDGTGEPKQIVRAPKSFPYEIECKRSWYGSTDLIWADAKCGSILTSKDDGSAFRTILDVRKSSLGIHPTALELVR